MSKNITLIMVGVSRNIQFNTVKNLANRKNDKLLRGIDAIIAQYSEGVLQINKLLMNQECKKIEEDRINQQMIFIPESSKEHIGEIDWMIQIYKERFCAICSCLKFRKMPRVMVCDMVKYSITCLNNIPAKFGIIEHISTQMVITVTTLYYNLV